MDRHRQRQAQVLTQLMAGKITTEEAAVSVGRSVRWIERKRPEFRDQGLAALVHGNTGRAPANKISLETRDTVHGLAIHTYAGFNFLHLADKLREVEGLALSARSVYRICREQEIRPPRPQKRRPAHRKRRERRAQEGEMLQLDGSPHDWLEGRGPRLTLINFIDDATGKKWREFRLGEDLEGYMRVMRRVIEEHGIPSSIYTDRTVIVAGASQKFKPFSDEPSGPSQFGRALAELGVTVILANSPQAKGRVERTHGTDQDRLRSELRLTGACTLDAANQTLREYDAAEGSRFINPAADPVPAWRPRPTGDLGDIFCIKETRVVAKDNTVRVYGRTMDIAAGPGKRSYAGARVQVHRRYDGSVGLFLEGERIGGDAARPARPRIRSTPHTLSPASLVVRPARQSPVSTSHPRRVTMPSR